VAALAQQAELERRRVGDVDEAVGVEGTAVVDAHHHRLPLSMLVTRAYDGNRQRRVRGRHLVHVVGLARGGALAVELDAVPAGDAALVVGFVVQQRRVGGAEHRVGTVRELGVGFVLDDGIGHVAQAGRRIRAGAVVLVVAAASGTGRGQLGQVADAVVGGDLVFPGQRDQALVFAVFRGTAAGDHCQ
jgi:hypothetical protein